MSRRRKRKRWGEGEMPPPPPHRCKRNRQAAAADTSVFYDDTLPELPHYEEHVSVPPGE